MPINNYSRKSLEVQLDIALNALFKAIESSKVEDLNFALEIFNIGSIKSNPLVEAKVVSFDGETYYDFNPFKAENIFCKQFLAGFAGERNELDSQALQVIQAKIDDLKEDPNNYDKWKELGETLGKHKGSDQQFKEAMIFLRNKRKEFASGTTQQEVPAEQPVEEEPAFVGEELPEPPQPPDDSEAPNPFS